MGTTDVMVFIPGITNLLFSLGHVILAGNIMKRRGLQRQAGGLLFFYVATSFLSALGQAAIALEWLPTLAAGVLSRVLPYAPLFLSWLFLCLSWPLLQLESTNWKCWILGLVWVALTVALTENLLALPGELWITDEWAIPLQDLGFGASVLGWGIFMGTATLLTVKTRRRIHQPLHRNRLIYWSLALLFTVVGTGLHLAGHETWGNGFHLLGAGSLTYIVLIHQLPDVRWMARQTMSYLATTLLVAGVYTASFLTIQYVLESAPGYSAVWAGATTALVLAILVNPLLNRAQRSVERKLSGAGYDPSRTLREYGISISNILDLERLATVIVGLISEALEIRRGALFVVHHKTEGNGYFSLRGVTGMGEDQPPGVLSVQSPVANWLRRERRPLLQYDIDLLPRFRGTPPEERTWLAGLNMDIYVPIHAKGEWIGLLALGPKLSGDRYFDLDLNLLSTLADQTAVALENARLFDDLVMRNMENERLNKELTAANRVLIQLDKAKSDFIHIASHELRTPLTKIRGYNDLLSELIQNKAFTPERGQHMTQGVRAAVQQLEEIAKTMFDVSKIDTETLTLNLWPISLESIMNEVADAWGEALKERKQTLVIGGLMGLPPIVADGARLKQAFSHLIQNAIKFTPDGGKIRILGRLRDAELPPEDRTVEIIVSDTGIGIGQSDLERIFEKFYRVGDVMLHSTGRTKFKGAGPGLGLTVVRGIVEAHGGFVWAESPGHDEKICPGAEFHVVLPVQPRSRSCSGARHGHHS